MVKNKKKKQKDFQKVKLKVGKKLKKADNVTNASFKSRSIQISQQLKTADTTQPTTKRKQNIQVKMPNVQNTSLSQDVKVFCYYSNETFVLFWLFSTHVIAFWLYINTVINRDFDYKTLLSITIFEQRIIGHLHIIALNTAKTNRGIIN